MEIENSSRGFVTAFFRQSGAFFAVFTTILVIGFSYLIITKPVYETHGSVVVKFGQDARPQASAGDQSDYAESDPNARQEIILSYVKIILSTEMLRNLVKDFGAYRIYPDLKDALPEDVPPEDVAVNNLLQGDLSVAYDQTPVIDIAVRNTNPEIATELATQIMQSFIHKRTEIYNKPQTDFLQGQIEEARQKLEKAQSDLQNFKQEAGISAIDEEMAQLLREKSDLNTVAYTAVTEAQSKLNDLETQEAQMRSTYRANSPMLIRLQNTIAVARDELHRRQADLNASKSSGGSLATRMANVDKRIAYLEAQRGRFEDLKQQVKIYEDNYLYYLKRGEEARINNLLNSQNITRIAVVDHPAVPVKPIKPRKTIFMAITLLAAMVAGAGTALSRELLDDRLYNPEQVYASLGVPVLATFEKEIAA